jgi:hypothetical protein
LNKRIEQTSNYIRNTFKKTIIYTTIIWLF